MRLLLLSRGGSSRLFNHGDRIICIHCFKWLAITSPFRKCVYSKVRIRYGAGAVVLRKYRTWPDSNPRPYGREIHDRRLKPLRHNWDYIGGCTERRAETPSPASAWGLNELLVGS